MLITEGKTQWTSFWVDHFDSLGYESRFVPIDMSQKISKDAQKRVQILFYGDGGGEKCSHAQNTGVCLPTFASFHTIRRYKRLFILTDALGYILLVHLIGKSTMRQLYLITSYHL